MANEGTGSLATGLEACDIAAALDASETAVSRWLAAARRGGPETLRSHPAPGPVAKLTPEQLGLIPDFLWHGPESYGFRGDVWTCERVAGAIYQEFGVSYSKSQVSRWVKHLGWTPQVPITRAIQRDEEAIERWRVESWPVLKEKARREHRALVFVDESGFYLLPGVGEDLRPAGRDASRGRVADARPSVGYGRRDAGRKGVLAGAATFPQRVA